MSQIRKLHVEKLLKRSRFEVEHENIPVAWKLLEDAHIFSQPYPYHHAFVHWEMLRLAIRQRDFREVKGQILRYLLAVPASITGRFPSGNTGRSEVSMFEKMPTSPRLVDKIRDLDKQEERRVRAGGVLEKYQRKFPLTRER